jgi:hypothetical protein
MNGSHDVVRTIRFDPTAQGDPTTRTTSKPWYKDPTGLFVAGFWSAQWGKVDISYRYAGANENFVLVVLVTVR